MGRGFIILGAAFLTIGLVLQYAPGLVSWFGRLPGDLRSEGERVSVYIPFTSMVVISVVLTIVLNLLLRFLNR